MSRKKIILNAATRRFPDKALLDSTSGAIIADAISAPWALKKMELVEFFQLLAEAGAVSEEIAPLYQWKRWIDDLEYQLRNPVGQAWSGNLQAIILIIEMAKYLVTMSPATLTAISTVLSNNTMSLVDFVANELGEVSPEITGNEIEEALERNS